MDNNFNKDNKKDDSLSYDNFVKGIGRFILRIIIMYAGSHFLASIFCMINPHITFDGGLFEAYIIVFLIGGLLLRMQ